MKLNEIQDLIKFVSKSGVSEVEIENGDFKLIIKTPPAAKRGNKGASVEQAQAFIPQQVVTTAPQVVPAAPAPAPAATAASTPPASTAEKSDDEDSKYITIKSPMIGTFYRRPSPDKPIFVNVGDEIAEDKVVCIIEAMKLFNEIEAEVSGKIVKVLVEDNTPVEYDQPLFLVDPS